MEPREQEKDIALPNSIGYNPTSFNHGSSVKLPSAAAASTVQDRRRDEPGIRTTISSPSRTLDQHHLIHHQQPQLQQHHIHKDSNPDPDPAQAANLNITSASNSKTTPQEAQPQLQPQPQPATAANNSSSSVRYRECLKNHAASMGGHVVDGCGEFMPGGEEGTPEALRCAACDCHRNFHRRENDGDPQTGTSSYYAQTHGRHNNQVHHTSVFRSQPQPSVLTMPPQQQHHKYSHNFSHGLTTSPTGPMAAIMMNFGGNGGAPAESSSEDLNIFQCNAGGQVVGQPSFSVSKKRFRTKFTQQQKERMHEFAEKLGWKIQKQDEQDVLQFCNENTMAKRSLNIQKRNSSTSMKKRTVNLLDFVVPSKSE